MRSSPINKYPLLTTSFGMSHMGLADATIQARALRGISLDGGEYRYASYRQLRQAMKGIKLEELFDALSLKSPLPHVYRTDSASLLMDGDGAVISLKGSNKVKHCSCYGEIWGKSTERVHELKGKIEAILAPWVTDIVSFSIDWKFMSPQGVGTATFEEELEDEIHDESYPYLGESISKLISRYLDSDETVMLILGTPGTGKTRFVRAVFKEIALRKETCHVLFTGDEKVLANEQIFAEFITGDHDVFVIEDADHLLLPRSDGNHNLHPFLTIADGIVKAQGRKIIFTTNLPNIHDVDDALIRPGRCFAALTMTTLDMKESHALVNKLLPGYIPESTVLGQLQARNTLATIYKLCKTYAANK